MDENKTRALNWEQTYEVNISAWIYLGDLLFENYGSVDRTACCRDACDKDLGTVCFKDFLDATPVCYLYGSYRGTDGDRIEA
jgi:hypothetical protein